MKKNKVMVMLLVFSFMLFGCTKETALVTEPEEEKILEYHDMAGRSLQISSASEKIFSTNPISAIFLYTLAPEKMFCWNYDMNDREKEFIIDEYKNLPNYGSGNQINAEKVISENPNFAVNVTTINQANIEQSDALSEQLGLPVVTLSANMEDIPTVYRELGKLLNLSERAELLASYAEEILESLEQLEIPEDEKISIYYGNGEDSLETAPAGSVHSQVIDKVQAKNIAVLEMGESRIRISSEQLLSWDPEIIILNGEPKANISGKSASETLTENPIFAPLQAVKNQQVYGVPNLPFSWIERPSGPNRLIGLRWLAKKVYPNHLDYDLNKEIEHFFKEFYHLELNDEMKEKLLIDE